MKVWVLVVAVAVAQVGRSHAQPSVNLNIPGFNQVFDIGGSTPVRTYLVHRGLFFKVAPDHKDSAGLA